MKLFASVKPEKVIPKKTGRQARESKKNQKPGLEAALVEKLTKKASKGQYMADVVHVYYSNSRFTVDCGRVEGYGKVSTIVHL